MPSTKRSRPDADENRAECYYTVRQRAPTAQEVARHQDRKARRDQPLEDDKKAEWHWQTSPFNPTGFTKSSESMDLKYAIHTDPHMAPAQWGDMTRYNSFVCEYIFAWDPRWRAPACWEKGDGAHEEVC
jgi:hypothetical protein